MKSLKSVAVYFAFLFISLHCKTVFSQNKSAYWQQHVAYTIRVKLDDNTHMLRADESIVYTNNAPDALNEIYFHLWANGYKNNRTPFARQRIASGNKDFHDAKAKDRGYIDSLHFMVDGKDIQVEYVDKSHEIARLKLNTPLQSGQSITISTPFRVKIPKTFSRMGHSGQAYYISQWYPKPAVYDRNGWNTFPYLDQGEFYSEFGSFDVSITLPENYVVAATGRLMNEKERVFLDNKSREPKPDVSDKKDKGVQIKKGGETTFPVSSSTMKTIEYVQDSVHDFAWFADKRYMVEKTDTVLASGRRVACWSMYTAKQADTWLGSAKSVAKTIGFYSEEVGEYPYNSATAVSGDLMPTAGGMEYPTVTLVSTKSGLEKVIAHEVGHNWFYGILGSQERQHPWMDEGINSFYENYFSNRDISLGTYFKTVQNGLKLSDLSENNTNAALYTYEARLNLDQPIDIAAPGYTQLNYGTIVYGKTPPVLRYLYLYLGKDEFKRLMHAYFEKWKFKHPMPEDIKEVFEKGASKDVSSFFGDMIQTDKKMDYAITKVKKDGNNYVISVKNTGGVTAPVFAAIGYKDSILQYSMVYNTAKKYEITIPAAGEAGYAMINPFLLVPDVYFANNYYSLKPNSGRFKPLHFTMLSAESPDKTNVLFSPVIAWNAQDKWMLGVGFSSDLFPPKRFNYQLMPMYAFGSNMLTGLGRLSYTFNPCAPNMRHLIEIGVNGKQFTFDQSVEGTYTKIQPYISWQFQRKPLEGTMKHEIQLSSGMITNHVGKKDSIFMVSPVPEKLMVNELLYSMHKGPFIHSFYAGFTFQNIPTVTNRLTAEMIMRRPSPIRGQQIYFRLFAGTLLGNTTTDPRYYIPLSSIGGYQDFAYDNLYFDRTGRDHFFGQQIEQGGGGFKFINNSGAFSTSKWMVTSTVAANIPKWPIRVYVDGGVYSDVTDKLKMEYDAGLCLTMLRENLEVYFPLIYSNDISTWMSGKKYGQQITFRINLKALDPPKLIKSLLD